MNPVNTKPYHLPPDATWLITGCSSGIGRALATLIASKPAYRLIATARDPSSLSYLPDGKHNILKLALDVTSVESVDAAFAAAAEHFAPSFHLDITINNAGYALSGDTESATEEQTHREMETLFFGTARVTMRAIANMRVHPEHRGGIAFNVSSLGGVCAFPGHAYYHAAKWAVEGWSESVAREVDGEWNINICILEPSGVKTRFETHSKVYTTPHPAYADPKMPARILEKYVDMGMKLGMGTEPDAFAETVFGIASSGERVPLRQPVGDVAWKMGREKWEGNLREWDEEGLKRVAFMGKVV